MKNARKKPAAYATYSYRKNGATKLPTMFGNITDLAMTPRLWRVSYEFELDGVDDDGAPCIVLDRETFLPDAPLLLIDLLEQAVNVRVDAMLEEHRGKIRDVRFRIDPVRR